MKMHPAVHRLLASPLLACGLAGLAGLVGLAGCGGKSAVPGGTSTPSMAAAPAAPASPGGAVPAVDASTVAKSWSGSQAAVDGAPARNVSLDLRGDGTASLTIVVGEKTTVRTGKWRTEGPTVQFDPVEKDGSSGSRIVWALVEGNLVPNAWSGDDWGVNGPPTLERK